MNGANPLTLLFLTVCCTILAIFLTGNASSESGGPVGGATSPVGWYVEDGDNVTYTNTVIMLNGDLIIQNGGTLNFQDVAMYSNARGDKDQAIRIMVEEGGTFNVIDSTITATIQVDEHKGNQPVRYKFQIHGAANLIGSTVSYMWGEVDGFMIPDAPLPGSVSLTPQGGVEIFSDHVIIQNCIITEGQTSGVCIQEGSPHITNTEFLDNGHHGLAIPTSNSWAVIQNCHLHDNEYFGVYTRSGNITFKDNSINDNDWMGFIASYAGNIRVENCEITGQRKGNWIINCNAEYFNCTMDNDENFDLRLDSNVSVVNYLCDIDGDKAIVLDNGSLSLCPLVNTRILKDGQPIYGAVVNITGVDGNYTWSKEFITDHDGKALAYAAIIQRHSDAWHNITEFEICGKHSGSKRSVSKEITGNVDITILLESDGNGGDHGSGDDGKDDDDSWGPIGDITDGDEDIIIIPIIVVVIAVVVFLIVKRGRRSLDSDMEEDMEEMEWE